MTLTSATPTRSQLAAPFADIVVANLRTPYPFATHHVQTSSSDRPTPAELYPAFHTSFDWHSCVHMHWLGVSLLEHGLDPERNEALRAILETNLTPANLAVEAAYLREHPSWERPYGWAWAVRLAATASSSSDEQIRRWGDALGPVVDVVADLVADWTAKAQFPVRHGLHPNSAFGLAYLYDAFRSLERDAAAQTCRRAAVEWFKDDAGWPGEWELSGQDFLSAGLSEADLMARILPASDFAVWFEAFLPGLAPSSRILIPATVTDETDGYLAHLNGLNLTRAGQLIRIRKVLATADSPAEPVVAAAIEPLLEAGLAAVRSEEYMSSHWLASFAWDALASQ